mgnify:CR=1 FL=1|jgi:NADPH:quinone reductase-like Zn-dependent oxidoreductase
MSAKRPAIPRVKAIACRACGAVESLRREAREPAPLAANEVRVPVQAAGVDFAGSLEVQGLHR